LVEITKEGVELDMPIDNNKLSDVEKYALEYFLNVLKNILVGNEGAGYSLKDSPEMRELSCRASESVYKSLNLSMEDVLKHIKEKDFMGGCFVFGEHMVIYLIKRLREVGVLTKEGLK
jgi:hypothetical protein